MSLSLLERKERTPILTVREKDNVIESWRKIEREREKERNKENEKEKTEENEKERERER